jgi:hypothetical protein
MLAANSKMNFINFFQLYPDGLSLAIFFIKKNQNLNERIFSNGRFFTPMLLIFLTGLNEK